MYDLSLVGSEKRIEKNSTSRLILENGLKNPTD
jgi:hypothetical protein